MLTALRHIWDILIAPPITQLIIDKSGDSKAARARSQLSNQIFVVVARINP